MDPFDPNLPPFIPPVPQPMGPPPVPQMMPPGTMPIGLPPAPQMGAVSPMEIPGGMPMGTPEQGLLGPAPAYDADAAMAGIADPMNPMLANGMYPHTNMIADPGDERLLHLGQAVEDEIERQVTLMLNPDYPPWYDSRDYPKPTEASMYDKAKRLEQQFSGLRRRIANGFDILSMDKFGRFPDFDEKEDFAYRDSGIVAEVELITSQMADCELSHDVVASRREFEDESAKKIDFLVAMRQQEIRDHGEMGYGPLERDEAYTLLTTGRLCWQVLPDPEANRNRIPLQTYLHDPTTSFPVFENKKGLREMALVYHTRYDEAIGTFETRENKLGDKYIAGRGRTKKKQQQGNLDEQDVEVIDFWNRRWRAVFFDGVCVLGPEQHNFGFVPFIYKLSPLGLPGYMNRPESMTERDVDNFRYDATWSSRDISSPSKGLSLIDMLRIPHQLHEAIQTKMLDALRTSFDPPLLIEIDDMMYKKGVPSISRKRKTVSPIRMTHHVVNEIPINPNAAAMQSVMASTMENRSKLFSPPTAHGENGSMTQLSGMALQGFNEAGRIKQVSWKKTLEQFQAEKGEMQLRFIGDWGSALKQGRDGEFGSITIGRIGAPPEEDAVTILTPADIRRSGISVMCSMNNMPVSMLGPLANALSIIDGLGLLDPIEALKMMGIQNPYRHMQRLKANRLINDPIVVEAQGLHQLYADGFGWIADYIQRRKFTAASGPGQPIGPDGRPLVGPGAMLPPEGPGSMAIGDNQAAFNNEPGVDGGTPGRPAGSMESIDPMMTAL